MVTLYQTVMDTTDSNWGSGSHPFHQDYYHTCPLSFDFKSATVHGNHVDCYPYSRTIAGVKGSSPIFITASGSDGNGDWYDHRSIHMEQWLPDQILVLSHDIQSEFDDIISNNEAECVTTLLNKLRDEKSGWGANVFQMRDTATLVADSVLTSYKALKHARHGQFKQLFDDLGFRNSKAGRSLGRKWLQYIYGWKPTLSDIKSGCDILSRHSVEDIRKKVTRSVSHSFDKEVKTLGFTDRYKGVVRTSSGITSICKSNFLDAVDSLGVINPLEIAWDLIPYSFVFDWFVPVGNVLSGLSASLGLDFVSGYTSTTVEIVKTSFLNDASAISDSRFTIGDPGSLIVSSKSFTRKVMTSFPTPEFYVNSNPFSTPRIGAAIALVLSR